MKKLILIALAALSLCCAGSVYVTPASAQVGCGPMVPCTSAPGIQVNLNAAADPTASNDSTQGYAIGSLWQNANTGRFWIARSVTASAASWTMLEPSDHPGYIAGNWYAPFGYLTTQTSGTMPVNNMRCYPGFVKERLSISSLGGRVIANQAGANVQFAVYANAAATGRPTGAVLASTASISAATAASVSGAASGQLNIGLNWFCSNVDTANVTFTSQTTSTTGLMGQIIGSATQANVFNGGSGTLVGVSFAQTFGTWPDATALAWTEFTTNTGMAGVQFLVNSVP